MLRLKKFMPIQQEYHESKQEKQEISYLEGKLFKFEDLKNNIIFTESSIKQGDINEIVSFINKLFK